MSNKKFLHSLKALSYALKFEKNAIDDDFYYGGIAKAFEVALEYSWKYLKQIVEEAGLECPSPRDAIKQAGEIGVISDVGIWLQFLRIRNIAVHDYIGLSKAEYLKGIKEFIKEAEKLKKFRQ